MYNEKREREKGSIVGRERERRIATLVEEIGRDGIEDRGRDGGNLTQAKKKKREIERGGKRKQMRDI